MATDDNKQLIRRYYDELWNGWNYDLISELIAPDISFRGSLAVTVFGRKWLSAIHVGGSHGLP